MRLTWTAIAFAAALLSGSGARADHELVLVVADSSPIEDVDALTIRKAYLGVNAAVDGAHIRPYLLIGDRRLERIFVQSVIAMTERSYERRLLALTLKYGEPRPEAVASPDELARKLAASPLAIGYMWREDAEGRDGIRIVKPLWRAD